MKTTGAPTETTVDRLLERISDLEITIRRGSEDAERNRRLSSDVTNALRDIGCFRMFRPRSRGGLEFDPVSAFRVMEELARIDTAVGWNVAIANACEPFGAWFPDTATDEVFGCPDAVMAGAFFPSRRAVPVDGGYELTGRCGFSSNCHAATWMLGLAHVYDGEVERLDDDGHPVTLMTLFHMKDARIIDNWDTLGMRGTGSHDVSVDSLFVPANRAVPFIPLEAPSPAYGGPAHRLTIWTAVASVGVSALGMAQAAIDDFVELATTKVPSYTATTVRDRSVVQFRYAKAVAKVESARAYLHEAFDQAWQGALDGERLGMHGRARLQLASTNVVMASAEAVELIHSLVGSAGIRNDQRFQRYVRDAHTMTQHAYVCESRLEAVGQIGLGLEPNWSFLEF